MQTRPLHLALFAAGAALLAVLAYLVAHASRASRGADPIQAVPRDAWLVATADIAALRSSALARALVARGGASAVPGLGTLAGACGFDPLERVERVVVCAPESGDRGEFGVAISGAMSRTELARCAVRALEARAAKPAMSTRGSFVVVAEDGEPGRPRFAYRDGGPFLVGRGAWLDAMIDAADGRGERLGPAHGDLLRALRGEGPAPSVAVTALLPGSVRQRLRSELGGEATGAAGEGEAAYAGVLGVSAAGVALFTGGDGAETTVRGELRCDDAGACDAVKRLLDKKRLALAGNFGVRLLGLGALVDGFTASAAGPTLSLATRAPTADLSRVLGKWLAGRPAPSLPAPAASP